MDLRAKFLESIIGKFKHLRYLNILDLGYEKLPNCITELYNLETFILQRWLILKTLPSDIKNLINLKHLGLPRNCTLELLPDSITELRNLETLILCRCMNLKELPRDVKNWINLRHLDLSWNYRIEFLPASIIELNNLERLLLYGCSSLKELPEDTKKLINLKHLDINSCMSLTHMPKGFGQLTNLEEMNEFILGDNNGGGLSELNGLNKLKGSLSIRNLQFCNVDDLQMKDKFLQLKSCLRELSLVWNYSSNEPTVGNLDNVYERVLDCLQPHLNLQEISIFGYKLGVKLCNWLSSDSLGCLVTIYVDNCKRLQHLPPFDQFPYLKHLSLENLDNVEYIGNNDSVSSSTIFPSLEELRINGMPKLKRWWMGTSSFSIKFPCLSKLYILMSWHAPLQSLEICDSEEDEFDVVPWENFKNLSSLDLRMLSKLEYLPKRLQHVTTLRSLDLHNCENLKSLPEWMDNLTSLITLGIFNCEKLDSLPKGFSHMHALQSLIIDKCPMLEERCKKDIGEDWPKIAHILQVFVSGVQQTNFDQSFQLEDEEMGHCGMGVVEYC